MNFIADTEPIRKFDINFYFVLVEKMTVFKENQIIITLLEGHRLSVEENNIWYDAILKCFTFFHHAYRKLCRFYCDGS